MDVVHSDDALRRFQPIGPVQVDDRTDDSSPVLSHVGMVADNASQEPVDHSLALAGSACEDNLMVVPASNDPVSHEQSEPAEADCKPELLRARLQLRRKVRRLRRSSNSSSSSREGHQYVFAAASLQVRASGSLLLILLHPWA